MILFNTRGKKSEPGLRKELNIEVKSTTKFMFFSLNILIYLYILLLYGVSVSVFYILTICKLKFFV